MHETLLKVRHLGFKFEQRTGATIWRTGPPETTSGRLNWKPSGTSDPCLVAGSVVSQLRSDAVTSVVYLKKSAEPFLLSSGNAPPINVRLFLVSFHEEPLPKKWVFEATNRKYLTHARVPLSYAYELIYLRNGTSQSC